jgi:hypothetical protein
MDTLSKNSPLHIAVLINDLSFVQLKEISQRLKRLAIPPRVLLMKQVSRLPAVFYRIRELVVAEIEALQTAEQELCSASQTIEMSATQRIIRGSHPSALLQALPGKIDYLIGKIEEKQRAFFFSKGCHAVHVDDWLATYAPSLLPKQRSPQPHPYLWMAKTLFPPLTPKVTPQHMDNLSLPAVKRM